MTEHEIVNEVWNIANPEHFSDNSTEYCQWHRTRPQVPTANLATDSQIEVRTVARDQYMWLKGGYIEVKGKVVKADGTDLAGSPALALVNNGGVAIFKRAELKLDNLQVQNLNNPAQAHNIRNLVEMPREHAETVGQKQFLHFDSFHDPKQLETDGSCDRTSVNAGATGWLPTGHDSEVQLNKASGGAGAAAATVDGVRLNPAYNAGFKKRVDLCDNSREISIQVGLDQLFDFCREYNRVMKGSIVEIILERETVPQKYIYGDITDGSPNYAPYFKITDLELWIPVLRPNVSVLANVERALASGKQAELKYGETKLFERNALTSTTAEASYHVPQTLRKPVRAYLAFQNATRRTSYGHNSMSYDYNTLQPTDLHVFMNGVQYPAHRLQVSSTDYTRALQMLHEVGCKQHEGSALITADNWRSHYPIFAFDFSHVPSSALNRVKSVDLECRYVMRIAGVEYDLKLVVIEERTIKADLVSGTVQFTSVGSS